MEEKISSRARALKLPESVTLLMRPSLCVGLVYVPLIGLFVAARHYSALDFIHLGTVWGAHNKSGTWGYDGQFYYQIARDPLGAAQYMDNAPYRYEHLLYSLLTWMLSFGNASLIPYALLLINLFSIVGSVEVVSRLLKAYGFSPWFSLLSRDRCPLPTLSRCLFRLEASMEGRKRFYYPGRPASGSPSRLPRADLRPDRCDLCTTIRAYTLCWHP